MPALLAGLVFTPAAHAAGLAGESPSAAALGMAGARVAEDGAADALPDNPASLGGVEFTTVSAGLRTGAGSHRFTAAESIVRADGNGELRTGQSIATESHGASAPYLFAAHPIPDVPLVIGIAAYDPHGIAFEWPDRWAGRNAGTAFSLRTMALHPALAWKISDTLQVGAGFRVAQHWLGIERTVRGNLADRSDDVPYAIALDGQSVSVDGGVLWKPRQDVRIGLHLVSGAAADVRGTADFDLPSASLAGLFPDQAATASLRFPARLQAGGAWLVGSSWKIAAEVEWIGHGAAEDVDIRLAESRPRGILPIDTGFRNTLAARLGGAWAANEQWGVLSGLAWEPAATGADARSPLFPETDTLAAAVGGRFTYGRLSADAGLQWRAALGGSSFDPALTGRYDGGMLAFAIGMHALFP